MSVTKTTDKSTERLVGIVRPNGTVNDGLYRNLLILEIVVGGILWLLMPSIIPTPLAVLSALHTLIAQDGLLGELWTSLTLNLEALALSTLISLVVSYGAAIPIVRPIATMIGKFRFVSLIGISFIMVLYLGGGHSLKLGMLTFGLTVFFVTSMVDVVLQIPRDSLDYVRTLRAGEWRVLWESQVLGTLGQAFDIIRQNAAMGWLMLTMVEGLVRSEGGIGRLLIDQEKHFSLAAIFAIQFVFLIVGIGQDIFIRWLKNIFAYSSTLSYARHK